MSKKLKRGDLLPPMGANPRRVPAGAMPVEKYSIVEWHPTPDPKDSKAEAVCLEFAVPLIPELIVVFMLRSSTAVDTLIAALERHRDSVWPPAKESS